MTKYTVQHIVQAKNYFSKYYDKPFREHQSEAIEFAVNSNKPVVALRAPCGSGKSLIGACIIQLYGDGIYLAHSKALQEQIISDHPEFLILKGRNNYQCAQYPNLMCDECPHVNVSQCKHSVRNKCTCEEHGEERRKLGLPIPCNGLVKDCEDCVPKCLFPCPYLVEKAKVNKHPLRVLNYHYFMLECNYGGVFRDKPVVICDEADKLDDILLGFIELSISDKEIKLYRLPSPHTLYKTACENGLKSWKGWAGKSLARMKDIIGDMPESTSKKEFEYATNFLNKLKKFISLVDETWRLTIGRNRYGEFWSFKPVWVTPEMTTEYFRKHIGRKLVLMSATLKAPLALSKEIGIPVDEIDYMEIDSLFPANNCPIHLEPVASLSRKNLKEEMPKIVDKINQILAKHKSDKGLLHAQTYTIAKFIMEHCNNSGRLITHKMKNRGEMLKEFIESDRPLVLVSPSMGRGISLNDNRCRFIIIAKAPYPDLSDAQINARLYGSGGAGKYWYSATTVSAIEQSIGRGVRSADDYCEVYIIDGNVVRLISQNRKLFSKQFFKCLKDW